MTSVIVPLCLACSQELSTKYLDSCFRTPCCSRYICDRCGVHLVQSSSGDRARGNQSIVQNGRDNEAETFVLGDSDDEEDSRPSPKRVEPDAVDTRSSTPLKVPETSEPSSILKPALPQSSIYYIKPRDTVNGIALKYGVDPRLLCQLNKLSTSTMTTTPHLLHTRTTLQLPQGARAPSPPPPDLQQRLEARARERAGKAFQAITKETDWGVAQTYVALLDVEDDRIKEGKRRMVDSSSKEGKQTLAIDQYLDDNAWEEEQRRAGLPPRVEPFPYFSFKGKESAEVSKESTSSGSSGWWENLMSRSSFKR